jgi:uncharacterized membrane protein
VSGDGSVIVGFATAAGGMTAAWKWTADIGFTLLTVPGAMAPRATCVSRDGRVVGGAASPPSRLYAAAVWTDDEMEGRLLAQGGFYSTWVQALSADGNVAVGTGSSGTGTWPVIWQSTYLWPLSLVPPGAGTSGLAAGISGDGATIVGHVRAPLLQPAIWTDRGLELLDRPTSFSTWLVGISDDGRTGVASASSGVYVFRRGAGMVELSSFLDHYGLQGCGEQFRGISANGRVMVAVGNGSSCVIDLGACGSADFDHNGLAATDQDIEAFFGCLSGDCCTWCDGADFNFDGDTGTDEDIEAFLRVLAGGNC